uniref:YqaJ viral recombinase domain-containing protein n=1 Tax=Salarias fasciatus TaxID=181472 RepID=A0A672J7X2_SALFA
MLFKLEAVVRCRETVTVTGKPAYWMIPGNLSKVEPQPGYRIDFTSSKAKRKALNRLLEGKTVDPSSIRTTRTKATGSVSKEQLDSFFRAINKASPQAAVLSCLPEYCDAFIDPVQSLTVPRSLQSLRDVTMEGKEISILREHCKSLAGRISLTNEQADYIESTTRKQNKSSTWHQYRAGRVTASNMHSVYVSSLDKPSQSVVNSVCYPKNTTNSSSAIEWGRQNENHAREMYRLQSNRHHSGSEVTQCGFFINPKFPEVGASPDGLVQCNCCGRGCIEIKCSYKYRDLTVSEACSRSDRDFCLELHEGEIRLKPEHPYYKQVQTQIFVTETEYCDFIVWTKKDFAVVRVAPDAELWAALLEKAEQFFVIIENSIHSTC